MFIKANWLGKAGVLLGLLLMVTGCGKSDTAYQEGMKLAQEGKYEKALSQFQQAVKEDNKVAKYYIGYGMTYNYIGKYEEAEKVFSSAIVDLKESASKEEKKQFYYGNAVALSGQGKYDEAVGYCDRALKISQLADMDADISFTKVACLERQGEYGQAEEACKELVKSNKKDSEAVMELAAVQRQSGKPEEAAKTYQRLIKDEKEGGDVHFALYQLYLSMGQSEDAEKVLNEVLEWNTKKAVNALAVGRVYYYKNDLKTAQNYFKQAYDGNCTEGLYYLGVLSLEEKKYDEAEKYFLDYIKENKEDLNVEVYNQLAVAMMEQTEYDKAQSYINKGKTFGVTGADQNLRKNQVVLYEKQKNYEEALTEAQEYVKLYPADAGMKKELAFIQTRMK